MAGGPDIRMELSYFPGCSLATTAKESNHSLMEACRLLGVRLIELEDWNCCGSSSAHMLDDELGLGLAARNLTLLEPGRPLMIMCPSCYKNLSLARARLQADPAAKRHYERRWGRALYVQTPIVSFLELILFLERLGEMNHGKGPGPAVNLGGLKVAPYYGCMLAGPPALKNLRRLDGLLERTLKSLGAEIVNWGQKNRCCGTFLSAARPEVSTELVDAMMGEAVSRGAECLVTACAMCQLNLEIRCTAAARLPSLHLSEVMALALGSGDLAKWMARHLVSPLELFRQRSIIT